METDRGSGFTWGRLAGLFRRQRSTNEILGLEWTTLETLWGIARNGSPPPTPGEAATVDELFAARSHATNGPGWSLFNEAEQRVGQLLTPAQLPVEFGNLLEIGAARNLANLATHSARLALFADPAKLAEQRAAYQALLYTLQAGFVSDRFTRKLRGEVASRLFWYGTLALLLALLGPALFVRDYYSASVTNPVAKPSVDLAMTLFSQEPIYGLVMVASFGILGAFFSRVTAFQDPAQKLTFDDVMRGFVGQVLRLRLLVGMIGAMIFYFLLRGELIGGSLFPNLSLVGIAEEPVWLLGEHGPLLKHDNHFARAGLTLLAPTADLAKLLVWSFIAGFSERLVPDALARTEARASKPAS